MLGRDRRANHGEPDPPAARLGAVSVPSGFKNSTDGSVQVAVDAVKSAHHAHIFLSVTKQGHSAIFSTSGNEIATSSCAAAAGARTTTAQSIHRAAHALEAARLTPKLMVDLSHANSEKQYRRQIDVDQAICEQLAGGEHRIMGVMIESNLLEGRQDIGDGRGLTYGQSVTDACIGWDDSVRCLDALADAVAQRSAVARPVRDDGQDVVV